MPKIGKKKISVLVVDDEPTLVEVLVEELTLEDYTVFSASNGKDAFDILKKNESIAIVISDIKMPGGDGIELLKSIKNNLNRNVEVILFSGYSDYSIDYVRNLGAEDLLDKPFDFNVVLNKIESISSSLSN